jgi:hypothetical protein
MRHRNIPASFIVREYFFAISNRLDGVWTGRATRERFVGFGTPTMAWVGFSLFARVIDMVLTRNPLT